MRQPMRTATCIVLRGIAQSLAALMLCATALSSSSPQQEKPPGETPTRENSRRESRIGERNSQSILVEPGEDYRIGPRDVIEIEVEDAPELSGVFEVNSRGTIPMRYLKVISVQGKTSEEVAKLIADGLRGLYLKDPQVSISIKEYNSKSFFIQGSVRMPGIYRMESRGSLFKLINLAGGLLESHGSIAFIVRELRPGTVSKAATEPAGQPASAAIAASTPRAAVDLAGQPASGAVSASPDSAGGNSRAEGAEDYEMTPVNIAGLDSGHLEQNIMLRPGDLVIVPKADVFFIAGEVVQPGEFKLKPGTSVRQAISLARGFQFKAATGNCKIFRQDLTSGQMKEIAIDAGSIMSGKKPDIPIMANDILQVPSSRAKSIGQSLLHALGVTRGMAIR